jgi:hypothetical protein
VAEREPWEPDPKWSDAATQAFLAYRDQPLPRSLRGLARQLDKSLTIVARWSTKYGWEDRCKRWDLHCEGLRRAEFEEGLGDAAFKEGEAAATLREAASLIGAETLRWVKAKLDADEDPFYGLTAAQRVDMLNTVARFLESSQRVSRLARGQTTEEHGVRGIDEKTTEQIEAYLTGRADEARASAKRGEPVK